MSLMQKISQLFDGKDRATFEEFFDVYLHEPTAQHRDRLFQSYFSSGDNTLLHAKASQEQFIVSTTDNFMARDLFVGGSSQFDRVQDAFDLLAQSCGIDTRQRTLIDIGANIGVICVPVVARGLCKAAVAVEPTPSVCRLLRANVALNGLEKSISVYETALGEIDGEAELEISQDNSGDNRITVLSDENLFNENCRDKITISTARFDTLFSDLRLEDCLIWMDVQGYEGKVLAGAKRALSMKTPIVSEFWPYGMRRAQTYDLMRTALSHYDRFCVLDGQKNWRPIAELDALRDSIQSVDYVDILVISKA